MDALSYESPNHGYPAQVDQSYPLAKSINAPTPALPDHTIYDVDREEMEDKELSSKLWDPLTSSFAQPHFFLKVVPERILNPDRCVIS